MTRSLPSMDRRVLIVADTLPFSARLQRPSKVFPEGRRRRSFNSHDARSSDFGEDSGSFSTLDMHAGVAIELQERHQHAALWIRNQLKDHNVLHVGKPSGVDPRLYENDSFFAAHLRDVYFSQKSSVLVLLDVKTLRGHAEGYCRTILRPLLHYMLAEGFLDGRKQMDMWNDYVKVNEAFAETILSVWRPGDLVWVLDYHLFLLPELLRRRVSDIGIGLYVKSPFPSSEFFRCLPESAQLLGGMLGANVIGFQTYGYSRHFTSSCLRILGADTTSRGVDNAGMLVDVVVQPIGIDPEAMRRIAAHEAVKQRAAVLKELSPGKKIVLGVDTLDQSRGILHKLRAIEKAFQMYPELVGKVSNALLSKGLNV